MSYNTSTFKRCSRLATPVRLGVAAVAACFFTSPVLSAAPEPSTNLPTTFSNLVGIDAKNIVYGANSLAILTSAARAAADVGNFNIAKGYSVDVTQPSASANVLFRVLANDPSVIYGRLSSNGGIYLVNPSGIFVGAGGRVDTAGFVASTLAIRNEDFLAGRNLFTNDGTAKDVINQGEIKTPSGGSVYLIGSNVTNEGIITTPNGETLLAAGATVSLIDSATPGVKVDITGAAGNATNLGTITAEAGRIGIAGVIVRNSGTLNASSAVSEGGRIFLKASQDAYVDGNGRIVTTGTKGGTVEVLGNRVAVMDNAEIDASGVNGGGRIMIGGDFQGKNPDIQNASITYFGKDAKLKADATEVGDGGTVIVWADDTTRAYGDISVRGGPQGGNGGFVEVSGHRYLDFHATVDRRAPLGKAGLLLLDPADITIGDSPDNYGGAAFYGGVFSGVDNAYGSYVSWGTIDSELGYGDLAITTSGTGGSGDITLVDSHSYSSSSNLSLLAHRNINAANKTLANGGSGDITLVAGWDGNTSTPGVGAGPGAINASGATFSTVGGNITFKAYNDISVGNLTTTGIDGGAGYGGDAGDVNIESVSGKITVAAITAIGGDGGEGGGYGGTITLRTYNAGNSITLGALDAGDGTINVYGGGAILDGNGSAWNLRAETINLTSDYGGAANGLAISADIWNEDDSVNTLNAQVTSNASHGGISLRVAGDAPEYVDVADNAASQNSIYFSATRDIDVDDDKYFSVANGGGITLHAGRDVNWWYDSDYTLDTTGSAIVSAGRDIYVDDWIYGNGGTDSILTLVAGRTLDITSSGYISSSYWNDVILIGGTINNNGSVSAGRDLDILAGSLNNYGSMYAGNDATIIAGNVYGADGGEGGGSLYAGHNIDGYVLGNITLTDGAYFQAGNDVNLSLQGAASTLSLSNGGYVLANVPDTITLDFTSRSSGGVMIDGIGTTTSLAGGSGLFVFDHSTPARAGAGLAIKYALGISGDICATDPSLCKSHDPTDSWIADYLPKASGEADKDEDKDGHFGDEDGKDGKKKGKRSKRKVAQCT